MRSHFAHAIERRYDAVHTKRGEHFAARAVEVFDIAGAGETVVAVLAVMLADGKTLQEAVAAANQAAGIVVAKTGTATLTMEELLGTNES